MPKNGVIPLTDHLLWRGRNEVVIMYPNECIKRGTSKSHKKSTTIGVIDHKAVDVYVASRGTSKRRFFAKLGA